MEAKKTRVLVLSPSPTFVEEMAKHLLHYGLYELEEWSSFEAVEGLSHHDVALIDEEAIEKDPTSYLARLSYQLSPIPLIYITTSLASQQEFTAVKSLASDYLLKDQLTSATLHNCIRYSIEAWRLRQEMEQQHKKYMSLFYNAIDACIYLRADWSIESVNQSFADMFGISQTKAMGMHLADLIENAENFEKIRALVETDGQTAIDLELKFKRLDRSKVFLGHFKLSVLTDYQIREGQTERLLLGYQGTLSNISYRSKLRNIAARADKVSLTHRLARTLAHEIRNPLTNITLSMNQLAEALKGQESLEMYLEIIERSTGRIDQLIKQLIHSSEKREFTFASCRVGDVLDELMASMSDRARLRGIKLLRDVEDEHSEFICNREHIFLALSNILSNAMEAIPAGQTDGQVIVGAYTEDEYLFFYIEDNGIGMSESDQESLFDPFFTKKKKGIGLGLTSSQTIIAEHQGEIEVESAEGLGSTFTISLPLSQIRQYKSTLQSKISTPKN